MRQEIHISISSTCRLVCHLSTIYFYHPQQVVWNLLKHHCLNAVLLSRGIERILYINADQRAESLTLTSSSSFLCPSIPIHHCLDSVYCGPTIPKAELILRKTVLANRVQKFLSLPEKDRPLPFPFVKQLSLSKTGVKGFGKDHRVYRSMSFPYHDLAQAGRSWSPSCRTRFPSDLFGFHQTRVICRQIHP